MCTTQPDDEAKDKVEEALEAYEEGGDPDKIDMARRALFTIAQRLPSA